MFSIPECLLLYGARAYDDPEYSAAFRWVAVTPQHNTLAATLWQCLPAKAYGQNMQQQPVIAIPTNSTVPHTSHHRQLQEEAGPVLDQRSLLVLLLVLEKCRGQASFFAPYVDLLPPSYGGCAHTHTSCTCYNRGLCATPSLIEYSHLSWQQDSCSLLCSATHT